MNQDRYRQIFEERALVQGGCDPENLFGGFCDLRSRGGYASGGYNLGGAMVGGAKAPYAGSEQEACDMKIVQMYIQNGMTPPNDVVRRLANRDKYIVSLEGKLRKVEEDRKKLEDAIDRHKRVELFENPQCGKPLVRSMKANMQPLVPQPMLPLPSDEACGAGIYEYDGFDLEYSEKKRKAAKRKPTKAMLAKQSQSSGQCMLVAAPKKKKTQNCKPHKKGLSKKGTTIEERAKYKCRTVAEQRKWEKWAKEMKAARAKK